MNAEKWTILELLVSQTETINLIQILDIRPAESGLITFFLAEDVGYCSSVRAPNLRKTARLTRSDWEWCTLLNITGLDMNST